MTTISSDPLAAYAGPLVVIPTPPPGPTAPGLPNAVPPAAKPVLSNVSNDVGLELAEIREFLLHHTGGWPKLACGSLCYAEDDPHTGRKVVRYLAEAAGLFAWVDRYCKVHWSRKTRFLISTANAGSDPNAGRGSGKTTAAETVVDVAFEQSGRGRGRGLIGGGEAALRITPRLVPTFLGPGRG